MKNSKFKNALLGIVLALVAAYLYVVAFAIVIEGPRGWVVFFSIIPFVVLFYTSWVIIPLGAALGMLLPQMAYGKTRLQAALHGAIPGAVAGLVSVLALTSAYRLRMGTDLVLASVVVYCALWTSAYASYRAKGQRLYR